ncbi:MAG: translational GTPase TypA [Pseudodesulfovibrio sp.]|uniref:Large ribosomal subunit assembly factor BipA n=1 Tax=Pseudodesulfovibrio aespoeensis (strain ATCC 700646 / DSM 10631 / Aspo-2) TaxID=643562 RepID=E6VT25_PSEA9|nr:MULTISPECIES: translational GTPase TypA [Pseudodesulfovibrio]MBU4474718.1 translational GTPase TypA [Pseudomonadota bacterium]ADU62075.1 GTP-binding protein TypA [Pseudodesulfovibrio aespoeensis Aspo-2]MBU4515955.1 translational GTPase TypA [Pseudomonadota bacterium]MBU4522843.1 translational GTPase TypA [Pseudomonadota bacterium]MBU4559967.1 translational GTPase TypA [Pseudomonadota bacterium]
MSTRIINEKIRNIAIIAHVDHGKTTLVDALFKQSGLFREGQNVDDRIMDSMDLERERGITISAKNCSVTWKGVKINIIDTPGHADFGGEVERSLSMADGAILLVDASEGPLPQTRFVLKKALEQRLALMVVVNKVDRQDARPAEVLDEIYDLFIDLDAREDQVDFPLLYAIGRDGIAMKTAEERGENLHILLDMIIDKVPGPVHDPEEPFQMLVSDLSYSDYVGRLAIGKVHHGKVRSNDALVCLPKDGKPISLKLTKLQTYDGLKVVSTETCIPGDIVVIAGIEDVHIGDTICTKESPKALPRITVDEPTVSMKFGINTSPLAGTEGKLVQAGKIRDRLFKETLLNVAIQVEMTDTREAFIVKGRGEFQMAILVEQMRREGFELSVGRPEVIYKHTDGVKLEPIEHLYVDCDEAFMGIVTEKLSARKARMTNMVNHGTGRVRLEFSVPSRSLIGYRDEFLTDTKGTGIMNSYLEGYGEYRGDFATRYTGSLVADRSGKGVAYGLFNLEPRGRIFILPGEPIYEGMIIGEHNRENDINVNPAKEKKLTNMRASGKDEAVTLTPVKTMTLEYALNFIKDDELVEVTPKSIRLRKQQLSALVRHREDGKKKKTD